MKFSNNNQFFIISNSYIDYLIKKNLSRTFFVEYKDKFEVVVSVKVKEIKK